MSFEVFRRFEETEIATRRPYANGIYSVLDQLRTVAADPGNHWAKYDALQQYAKICFWAIRKQEYSFAAEALSRVEAQVDQPLRILDLGCGVVPFCNWMSTRGHQVFAIDPLARDIEFLTSNDLNAVYGSHVQYEVGLGEHLRFPDDTFDVVTCISVLEHTTPGNDRLVLWEAARVLKPGGNLILTFDVAPEPVPQEGEPQWSPDVRGFAHPFSPRGLERLFRFIGPSFEENLLSEIPNELASLTWQDVHAFWRAAQQHDVRDDPEREYLAMGAHLHRAQRLNLPDRQEREAALLEGQRSLEQRLEFFEAHADKRLNLIDRLSHEAEELQVQLHEKEDVINELSSEAQQRLEIVHQLADAPGAASQSSDVDARLAVIERLLEQQAGVLSALADTTSQRVEALLTTHGPGNAPIRAPLVPPEPEEIAQLRRERDLAEAMADARLQVIEQQRRAIQAYERWRFGHRIRSSLAPRIGVLHHYDPRPLVIPASYDQTKPPVNAPVISLVTPTLNQGRFIERTLSSVLRQAYPRLEYIVQDGGSADETRLILNRYESVLARTASEPDTGLADALNRGFRHVSGDILAYLNSDDLLLPGALNYVAQFFTQNPDVDVVYGHRVLIDEYDAEIGRWVLPPHDDEILSWADYVPQETMFWRRSVWEKIGAEVDESFRFAVDWDLLLRFREVGATMRRLPRFLGAFRIHPHQKTSQDMVDIGAAEMDRLRQRVHGRHVTSTEIHRALQPYLRRHVVLHKLYRAGVVRY
ncbi:MAG: hypothetical protein NVSMB2_01850 [Chloroflexota bacterium]